ncbi:mycothiol transferase [Streptomyces sp.]|uniref:mycothiol transferase n=1 Tax=Streptomyces sp. TaxID=1931 RepID=UPI002F922EAB
MKSAELLTDAFSRVQESVHEAVEGLLDEELAFRPDPDANSIAWLVWHLTRIQDDHITDAFELDGQLWTTDGWADRFGLPFGKAATGYGQTSKQVAAVRVPGDLLLGYYDAVHTRTLEQIAALTNVDLERVVDTSWNPPVTLGVRLISVITDDLQHAGQAAYVRGVAERRG